MEHAQVVLHFSKGFPSFIAYRILFPRLPRPSRHEPVWTPFRSACIDEDLVQSSSTHTERHIMSDTATPKHILALNESQEVLQLFTDLHEEAGYRVTTQPYAARDFKTIIAMAPT